MSDQIITTPPVADWITGEDLYLDPFPLYARLRAEAPVAFVPATGHCVISRFDDCRLVERARADFTAVEPFPMMDRAVGVSMLRRDDPEHSGPRHAVNSAVRTKQVREHWRPVFADNTSAWLDRLAAAGPGADLNTEFAAPLAATNLRSLVGLTNVDWRDIARWSANFIAATANIAGDPDIWAANELVHREVDEALDEMIPELRAHPDGSILSSFIHAGLPDAVLRSNTKLCIAGGVNEPQHSLTGTVWALATRPEQARLAASDPQQWYPRAFAELVRWVSPIGAIARMASRDVEIGGVTISAGTPVLVSIHSANRDESRFDAADDFDITSATDNHYAFGSGPHMCAGRWAAECAIGEVALPMLFERFPDLHVIGAEQRTPRGWIFRGIDELPVTWDSVSERVEIRGATRAVVAARREVAEDIIELELAVNPMPAWSPGAHVTLTLPGGMDRHYSIISADADAQTFRILVQLDGEGRGGSRHLHSHAHPGTVLGFGGVRNNFEMQGISTDSGRHYRFLAGGIGITPLLPMVEQADRAGAQWTLDYVGRKTTRMPYLAELIQAHGAHIRAHVTGDDGRPDLRTLVAGMLDGDVVYACGPAGFLDEMQEMVSSRPGLRLCLERFVAADIADRGLSRFTVTTASTGESFDVGPDDTIVDVLSRAGVEPTTSCLEGVCGTCETKVLGGVPCHRDSILTPAERESVTDRTMICVARSHTPNLVLDL